MGAALEAVNADRYMWHDGTGFVTMPADRCLFTADSVWPYGYIANTSDDGLLTVVPTSPTSPTSPVYAVREVAVLSLIEGAETADGILDALKNPQPLLEAVKEVVMPYLNMGNDRFIAATSNGPTHVTVWAVRSASTDSAPVS